MLKFRGISKDNYDYAIEVKEKYWTKVNKTTGCWLWTGYDTFSYAGVAINYLRFSFALSRGIRVPKNHIVITSCGQRCVRPEHLILKDKDIITLNYSDKFLKHVVKLPEGCWIWSGDVNKNGEGILIHNGELITALRYAYELSFNYSPLELKLLKCERNASCVQPQHIRVERI